MAGTTQEDDLIILTEDIQTESPEMVINLDDDKDLSTEDDLVLTFDEPEAQNDIKEEITLESEEDPFQITEIEESKEESLLVNLDSVDTPLEETLVSEDTNNVDLDFGDLTLDTEEVSEIKTDEKVSDIIIEEDNSDLLDFTSMTEEITEVKEEEKKPEILTEDSELNVNFTEETVITNSITENNKNNSESIGTMESILNDTISKLEKRQNIIHSEEEKQELAISHLEEEIKQLESEKEEALKIKTDLEAEDKKIKTNITQLDKMKAAAEDKTAPKAKK